MPYEREGPVLRSLVLFGGHGSVGLLPLFPARSSGGGNEPEDQRLSDLPFQVSLYVEYEPGGVGRFGSSGNIFR